MLFIINLIELFIFAEIISYIKIGTFLVLLISTILIIINELIIKFFLNSNSYSWVVEPISATRYFFYLNIFGIIICNFLIQVKFLNWILQL